MIDYDGWLFCCWFGCLAKRKYFKKKNNWYFLTHDIYQHFKNKNEINLTFEEWPFYYCCYRCHYHYHYHWQEIFMNLACSIVFSQYDIWPFKRIGNNRKIMVIIICQTVTIVNFFFFIFFSIYYHHHQQYGCLFCFQRYNKQTNKLMRIYFFFTIINNIFTIDNFVVFFKPKIFMTFVSFFTLYVQILLIDYHWWSNAENLEKHFFFLTKNKKQILLIDLIWNQFIATTTTTLLTQKENPKDV